MLIMESLDAVLGKIKYWKMDLNAELPAQGHYEDVPEYGALNPRNFCDQIWIVDKLAEPDLEKRMSARDKLNSILKDTNQPCIIKYAAARTLRIKTTSKYGYYPAKIFVYEHPIVATITGIITLGITACWLGYMLIQHINKQ